MILRSESCNSHAVEWACAQKLVVRTRWNGPTPRKSQFARGGEVQHSENACPHAVASLTVQKFLFCALKESRAHSHQQLYSSAIRLFYQSRCSQFTLSLIGIAHR